MVAQPRRPGHGDRLLHERSRCHIQRLRPAQAVSPASLKRVCQATEIVAALQLAVAVDDDDQVPPRRRTPMFRAALESCLGLSRTFMIGMNGGQRPGDRAGLVDRSTVHNQDLEPVAGVILVNQLLDGPCDELGLVPHRYDNRDKGDEMGWGKDRPGRTSGFVRVIEKRCVGLLQSGHPDRGLDLSIRHGVRFPWVSSAVGSPVRADFVLMSPFVTQSTEGLPLRLDEFSGSRPSLATRRVAPDTLGEPPGNGQLASGLGASVHSSSATEDR